MRRRAATGGDDGDPNRGREEPMRIETSRNARERSRHFVAAARRIGLGDDERYNGHVYRGGAAVWKS